MRTASNLSRFFIFATLLIFVPSAHAQDDSAVLHHSFLRDKHFQIAMSVVAIASMADVWSSEQDYNQARIVESNPIFFAAHPSPQRFVLIGAPIEFGVAFASYKMSRSSHAWIRHASWLPVIADAGIHLRCAINNEELRK